MSIDSTTPLIPVIHSPSYSCLKECVIWRGRKLAYFVSALLGILGIAGSAGAAYYFFDPQVKVNLPPSVLGAACIALTIIVCLGACCLFCYIPSSSSKKRVNEIKTKQADTGGIIDEQIHTEEKRKKRNKEIRSILQGVSPEDPNSSGDEIKERMRAAINAGTEEEEVP